jgi:hypothetical protein
MKTLIVLFNLKPGTDKDEYENWANTVDLPTVRGLTSIKDFRILRSTGMFGADTPAPYQYVEIIDVSEWQQFGTEIGTDVMQKVAAEYQQFADNPQFIVTGSIE